MPFTCRWSVGRCRHFTPGHWQHPAWRPIISEILPVCERTHHETSFGCHLHSGGAAAGRLPRHQTAQAALADSRAQSTPSRQRRARSGGARRCKTSARTAADAGVRTAHALRMTTIAGIACSTLLGCASPASDTGATTHAVDGVVIVIAPLTAGTWTARPKDSIGTLPRSSAATLQLRRAIETASSCRITDSDYSEGGRQFDAQVDCKAGNR